jgi:hypothetical protein
MAAVIKAHMANSASGFASDAAVQMAAQKPGC